MGNAFKTAFPIIPSSNERSYYIDPKIINKLGKIDYNPKCTNYRVNKEEFLYLRDKAAEKGGSPIKIAQIFWFARQTLFILLIIILIVNLARILSGEENMLKDLIVETIVYTITIIIVIIMTRIFGDHFARKGTMTIKVFLREQNNILYRRRGLYWRIHPTCVYIQLVMDEDYRESTYIAPSPINE